MRDRRTGSALPAVTVLLLLLLGAGGFNYHRNWQAEQADQQHRPLIGYSDEDLEALAHAYQEEIDGWEARMARHGETRVRDTGLLAERVAEFDRVRARSERYRDLSTEVADRQARIRDIRDEQRLRAARPTGLDLHLARLTTF